MDEQLALLVSLSASDLETCRAALASAGGDLNLAAQRLTTPGDPQRCAQCGKAQQGFYGQGGKPWPGMARFNGEFWRRCQGARGKTGAFF